MLNNKIFSKLKNIDYIPLILTIVFTLIMVLRNKNIFSQPFFETGDIAANSIRITQAKHFSLLTGHHSNFGFNHPGPLLMYFFALSEIIFLNIFHVVSQPYNAHLIGAIIFQSFMFFSIIYLLKKYINKLSIVIFCLTILLISDLSTSIFISTWVPKLTILLFVLHYLSLTISISNKKIPSYWFVGTLVLLFNFHIGYSIFIMPTTLIFLYVKFKQKQFFNNLIDKIFSIFLLCIGIIPFLINNFVFWPGELKNYYKYAKSNKSIDETLTNRLSYMKNFICPNYKFLILYILSFTIFIFIFIFYRKYTKQAKEQLLNFVVICSFLISITIYTFFGIISTEPSFNYISIFVYSFPILLFSLAFRHIDIDKLLPKFKNKNIIIEIVILLSAGVLLFLSFNNSAYFNDDIGNNEVSTNTNIIKSFINKNEKVLFITSNYKNIVWDPLSWELTAGSLSRLYREKYNVCVEKNFKIVATKQLVCSKIPKKKVMYTRTELTQVEKQKINLISEIKTPSGFIIVFT